MRITRLRSIAFFFLLHSYTYQGILSLFLHIANQPGPDKNGQGTFGTSVA